MINAKTNKEKQSLLKAKIVSKIIYKVEFEGCENMEEMQSEVAQELHDQAGVELDQANKVVRLLVADFIKEGVA